MRFEQRLRDGIQSGAIVLAFLTLSLDVGYRLSPRGESYLNHLRTAERHPR